MSKSFDVREQLATFTGTASLFPLPNVVHFPHLLLPLHIFEPRYRSMVADALEGDRLIGMAILKPGFVTTEGSPPIHETVCLGRINGAQQTDDGRYYLVLQGLARARVIREESLDQPYRVAQLELQPDPDHTSLPKAADAQRRRLLMAFRKLFPNHNLDHVFRRALKEAVPLGILCDVLADAMSLESQVAYRVLAETDIQQRCRLVMRLIQERLRECGKCDEVSPSESVADKLSGSEWAGFPPEFSLN